MRLIDADALIEFEEKAWDGSAGEVSPSSLYNIILDDIREAPTIEAVPSVWFKLLCKKLEDRCPPDRECIVSNYEGTCEECWKEWCKDVLNEG